ncbi:YybH family protein [Christiangramia sediminis]|uniref:Nuclear transport factor 2 family protein n=1 Tax=Christiangramia sediminis TaxID=2881336 RepID=A0A9X1LJQ1_9FLAO|nr:nuclear transport factor 2 family protein [Christiangramia sediminis]MCB7481646.1 nuclear transport factor 2 family protein [Christiangramia sediminis]
MKVFKLLPIFALLLFSSCDEEKKETDDMDDMAEQADLRDPSEANKQWIAAWNRNNPQELDTLTSKDAVLYMQGQSMSADSIRSWYKNAAPMMKDLKTTPEVEYSGDEVAYEAGTYMHGIKNDSTNASYQGSYTFIWKKMNNDWKLQVMNITDKENDTTATN